MGEQMTLSEKQYFAKILYTTEKLEQKLIAKKVGVSEKTVGKWVNDFNWKALRNRLLVGKEEILNSLYEQLDELTRKIRERAPGERYADTKEADSLIKLTASARNLETELAIADLVESGKRFIKHLQANGSIEQVVQFADLWHSFIQESISK